MKQMTGVRQELSDIVRGILREHWDPIRIQELPENFRIASSDEYDRYIEPIVKMITRGDEKATLERYLLDVETQRMGQKAASSRAAVAAGALFDLEARFENRR